MMPAGSDDVVDALEARLHALDATLSNGALGVAVYDYQTGRQWSVNGDRWFHAASVMKVAVLASLFERIDRGPRDPDDRPWERFTLDCRLHVRNRFLSIVGGAPFRVDAGRDGDADVHAAIGRTLRLRELAAHMIVRSSNLATNLLLDLLTPAGIMQTVTRLGIDGIHVCRGVEDDRAFEQGISNRVTPDGVVALLRAIVDGKVASAPASAEMIDILHDQAFTGTIEPGLPDSIRGIARVAHKTGEISTVSHDAGVVFLPGRSPYVVAILVESAGDARERSEAGIAASAAVYATVTSAGEGGGR
jgi:beta-lactamase class A